MPPEGGTTYLTGDRLADREGGTREMNLEKSAVLFQEVRRDFADELRGFVEDDAAVVFAADLRRAEEEAVFGAGDGDIKQTTLFRFAADLFNRFGAGE
jgi:hypothetical protein